jgi:TRAP transporter TAXI family solute receptor
MRALEAEALLQSVVIRAVFQNRCLTGETMSARMGAGGRGPNVAAIFVLGLLWGVMTSSAQEAQFFRIGAAATSGTFFEVGGAIASAISKPAGSPPCERGGSCGVPGLVAVAQATQGSVENIRMIAADQIESGIAQSDIAGWAYAGAGIFTADGPMKDLRAIANLFPEDVQIVVRADSSIRSLSDLKGKRISLGQMGSGTLADARVILAAAGLGEKDLSAEYLRPGVAAANVTEGSLDGFFLIGGTPVPLIRALAATTPIRLIPIEDEVLAKLKADSSSYRRSVIPAGTYPGIDVETPSLGFNALWIVSADASEELIYAITKSLWNEASQRLLAAHNPIGRQVRLDEALEGLTVPLHPGAQRFYREAGLPVDEIKTPSASVNKAQ